MSDWFNIPAFFRHLSRSQDGLCWLQMFSPFPLLLFGDTGKPVPALSFHPKYLSTVPKGESKPSAGFTTAHNPVLSVSQKCVYSGLCWTADFNRSSHVNLVLCLSGPFSLDSDASAPPPPAPLLWACWRYLVFKIPFLQSVFSPLPCFLKRTLLFRIPLVLLRKAGWRPSCLSFQF